MVNGRCATGPQELRFVRVWNWSSDFFGAWIFGPPCGALNGPCRGAILTPFGCRCGTRDADCGCPAGATRLLLGERSVGIAVMRAFPAAELAHLGAQAARNQCRRGQGTA